MSTKLKEKRKIPKPPDKVDLTINSRIFIVSLLVCSFLERDLECKTSVLKYCAESLNDRQFRKLYKSCTKLVERLGEDPEELNRFIAEETTYDYSQD